MTIGVLNLEGVRIGFRNFEGREGKYNRAGDRSFVVFLDHGLAEELANEGWNVKFPINQNGNDSDEDTRQPYLSVSVAFENFPPNVFIIADERANRIGEEEVGMLDWAEIENVDLVIRPYQWTVNKNTGVKAYLKAGYFTIITDRFASKYGL